MSADELTELERLADRATPPPWTVEPGPYFEVNDGEGRPVRVSWLACNALFIAAARTALPALIRRVRDLEAGLAAEREACAKVAECYVGPTDRLCLRIAADIRSRP